MPRLDSFLRLLRRRALPLYTAFPTTSLSPRYVLVDYANVRPIHRERGAAWLVQHILDALGTDFFPNHALLHFRFYGGWYGKSDLSKHGQRLSSELRGSFPNPFLVATRQTAVRLRVAAELARGLLLDPAHDVLHTFRRGNPLPLTVRSTPFRDCALPTTCLIAPVEDLIRAGVCPVPSCGTTRGMVFERG